MNFFTCLNCGDKVYSDDYYCSGCGKVINGEVNLPSKKLSFILFTLIVVLSFAGILAVSTMLGSREDGSKWGLNLFVDSSEYHSTSY